MNYLKTIMEDDRHIFLRQQILLYLPLATLLECKKINNVWNIHIRTLFGNEWTQWANAQLAQKMSAAMNSVIGGSVVHSIHLSKHFKELHKRNYVLGRCYPFKECIVLQFGKEVPGSNRHKYEFNIVAQDNIHIVKYAFKFAGTLGWHFSLGNSLVMWWYVLKNEDYIKLNFNVLADVGSLGAKCYETTIHLSDFVSPEVAYHALISGEISLRMDMKKQFPGLNIHMQRFHPSSINVAQEKCYNHVISYYKNPPQEPTEIWVLNVLTMKVEIKRNTTKRDWTCNRNDLPQIKLIFYRHPYATFHIQTINTFAIWDLSQPGHPRHIGFEMKLPMEPWDFVHSHVTRSKWIIEISKTYRSNFIYVNLPSTRVLKNSSVACECATQHQVCQLEEHRLQLKATQSSHASKTYAYFIGERIVIEGIWQPPYRTYIRDSWKSQEDVPLLPGEPSLRPPKRAHLHASDLADKGRADKGHKCRDGR